MIGWMPIEKNLKVCKKFLKLDKWEFKDKKFVPMLLILLSLFYYYNITINTNSIVHIKDGKKII